MKHNIKTKRFLNIYLCQTFSRQTEWHSKSESQRELQINIIIPLMTLNFDCSAELTIYIYFSLLFFEIQFFVHFLYNQWVSIYIFWRDMKESHCINRISMNISLSTDIQPVSSVMFTRISFWWNHKLIGSVMDFDSRTVVNQLL